MIIKTPWPGLNGQSGKNDVQGEKMKTAGWILRKKAYLIWLLAFTAVVVLIKTTLMAPPKVKAVRLEKRDLTAQVYGNGTVEAKVVVGVSSKITGRIVQLHADQGDRVRRGQMLAKLENEDFIHQVSQAEFGVAKVRASKDLESANLEKARANLELAERNMLRYRNLAEKNLVSRLEAELYDTACRVAKEEVNRCKAALEAAGREEDAARANQGFTRSRLGDTVIYAPQNGMIISRDLETGAIVTPGQAIFTLADPKTFWVKANVDESQLKGVIVGKKALISLRSAPGEQFPGTVARVAHESDRVTEELEVDVAFALSPQPLRSGEQSDVYIISQVKKGVASIPSAALITRGTERGVWVLDKARLKFRPVKAGIEDRRNFTEIVSGLDENDRIVMAPPPEMAGFTDGMKVRVAP